MLLLASWNSRLTMNFFYYSLYIICLGCAILASAIIPLQLDTQVASLEGCAIACVSALWLICIGFSIVFSALYAKTRRINKIMQSAARFKKIQMKLKDTVKPMVILLLCKFELGLGRMDLCQILSPKLTFCFFLYSELACSFFDDSSGPNLIRSPCSFI